MPRQSDAERFDMFVRCFLSAQNTIPPKLLKKRKGRRVTARLVVPYFPRERGRRSRLVPRMSEYPCERCADAHLNRACPRQVDCMCFAFWGMSRAENLTNLDGMSALGVKFPELKGAPCTARSVKPSRRTPKRTRSVSFATQRSSSR